MAAQAKIEFTEVMYDPAGTDTGREWVEIHNAGSEGVDIGSFKLFEEGVNHLLKPFGEKTLLEAGQFGVIADDPSKFSIDWPAYSGLLFDSSFSLKNTGETLILRGKETDEDSLLYDPTLGAHGDGNSLQKQITPQGIISWTASTATPGSTIATSSPEAPATTTTMTTTTTATTTVNANATADASVASTDNSEPVTPPSSSIKTVPIEPQIFCKIEAKSELFTGIESTFSAQAVGLKKQPLQNARYVWNFGDGKTKEGQHVLHTYTQPGVYEVFLATASDVYSATDRLRVTVRLPQLALSHSKATLVIANQSTSPIDLFGLKLSQNGRADFLFPEHSVISTGSEMNIDAQLFAGDHADVLLAGDAPITLRYLNDRVVATSTDRAEVLARTQPAAVRLAKVPLPKVPTKEIPAPKTSIAKPKPAEIASAPVETILLSTTAKERKLNYYGATIGILALLVFAWWYLLR